jgi:hypothetical protein
MDKSKRKHKRRDLADPPDFMVNHIVKGFAFRSQLSLDQCSDQLEELAIENEHGYCNVYITLDDDCAQRFRISDYRSGHLTAYINGVLETNTDGGVIVRGVARAGQIHTRKILNIVVVLGILITTSIINISVFNIETSIRLFWILPMVALFSWFTTFERTIQAMRGMQYRDNLLAHLRKHLKGKIIQKRLGKYYLPAQQKRGHFYSASHWNDPLESQQKRK